MLLFVVVCCCLLLFVVVCCCLLLFVVVCCCLLLFVVVCCCLLLFVVVVVVVVGVGVGVNPMILKDELVLKQNHAKKLPNVSSEILEKQHFSTASVACGCGSKTASKKSPPPGRKTPCL